VIAYKFLRPGAVGPFSGFRWPRPGRWVEASGAPLRCRRGVHACQVEHLPWWLADELWEVELAGEVVAYPHKLAAPRGRLVRRVDRWTAAASRDYVHACAWRARDRAVEAADAAAGERLAGCATLEALRETARELAGTGPHARVVLIMAADGAQAALAELPAMGAYVAAHAARQSGGEAAMDAERRWQAGWLVERLGLSAG
jgi:hypothetical protein